MPLSRSTVRSLAALCGGIPDITFTVVTASGGDLWVAEHPDAQLCVHGFRRAILEWPDSACHEPTIESVAFDDFDEMAGVLSRDDERWFVSPLTAEQTAACLRSCGELDASIDAIVREDLDFDVSVVRLSHAEGNAAELDEAALSAYAACLADDLVRGAQAHTA